MPELRAATRIADIGSGAGFPGLVLAVALQESRVDLIESARRKCEVIERLAAGGRIENARAVPSRAEEWGSDEGRAAYEAVTVRAVASLAVLVEYAAPLLREGGVLIAWKGAVDRDEEEAGLRAAEVVGMEPGAVIPVQPFEGSRSRHLHVFAKLSPTPAGFPRRPGMAAKRPLG